MDKARTFEDVMLDPMLRQRGEQISDILENVWNVGKLTEQELKTFTDCIQTAQGRKLFRAQLNKYRISHRKMINDRSFKTLKRLLWLVLDKMREAEMGEVGNRDIDMLARKPSFVQDNTRERLETCMDCMIMSETFFKKQCYDEGDEKIFLQQEIKYHSVWQDNERYWREIIIHSIRGEVNGPNMSEEDLKSLFKDNFIEITVETKLNWFVQDMVSYEIDLSTIENIIKVIALMYCVSDDKVSQILLLAKAKCEERIEYGRSNQLSSMAALNEESETQSLLIEKDIKESDEEAKIKIEEEKSMQGNRKNTIDNLDEPALQLLTNSLKTTKKAQTYLEGEGSLVIRINKLADEEGLELGKGHFNSLGKYESTISERLLPVEQSQRAASVNYC